MTDFTLGEQLAQRELRKERRAGTEHYVLGQHHVLDVEREGDEVVAALAYCTMLGLVVVPMVKTEDGWEPVVRISRVVGLSVDYGMRDLPPNWKPSAEMIAVLDAAVAT